MKVLNVFFEERAVLMEKIRQLISEISPSIVLSGSESLAYAILHAEKLIVTMPSMDPIRVVEHIYTPTALETGKPKATVIKALSRVTTICWMNGENEKLNRVIGTRLPMKPTPKEFILYCAYYLVYDKPYHRSGGPMPF